MMRICVFHGLPLGIRKSQQAELPYGKMDEMTAVQQIHWASIFYRYVCYLSIFEILVLFIAIVALEIGADHTLPISVTKLVFDALTPLSAA